MAEGEWLTTEFEASRPRLRAATGAPVWFGGRHRLSRPLRPFEINTLAKSCDWGLVPDRILYDGERLAIGGVDIEVIATPGHCANHLAFGLPGTPSLLTGDHIMGWNSTLVAVPGPLLITGTLHVGTATAIGQVPEAERGHIGGTTAALPAGS